ncbi:MAG: TatD family hydrolase [Flavobacteriales bacterium]|nr:TatD family hydrolase [Flavobacteriales bacterium]
MAVGWTDTHAHLYADEFKEDLELVVNRALKANVDRIFLPNIDVSSISGLKELTANYPDLFFGMMGLHPCSVDENYKDQLKILKEEITKGGYKAIGEIGMDLYWDQSTRLWQEEAFCIQCEWASELNLPIAIHSRDATTPLIELLEGHREWAISGVFHCFGGSLVEAERIIELGFYLGIGGVATFKNTDLREIIRQIPMDRILLETDAPYLAPVPFRGKRNESSYIPIIGQTIADVYHSTIDEIRRITTQNASRLFSV